MKTERKIKKVQEEQNHISGKQKEEIKKAFDLFDVSGSGIIEMSNLKVVLRSLGFEMTLEEIGDLYNEVDPNSIEKRVDFKKFLDIIIFKISEKESSENNKKLFSEFEDVEKRGKFTKNEFSEFISKKSLMNVIRSLDADIAEEEVEEMIVRAINKGELLGMSEIRNEEKEDKRDFDSVNYLLTPDDFFKILNEEIKEELN